ncbi:MAG TPA: cation:proton antiporter [Candidatus Tectomicrobia bacterium]|nr:cation:proton antiporter [Candidatus Tectomicrobia bacterium]
MTPDPVFFRDLALVFGAAVLGAAVAHALRQPLILGYVLGGVVIGPFTPGPSVTDVHTFELFAEIGVVLLMFSIGLEFSLRDLLRVKWVAIGGGSLGIVLSGLLGAGVGWLLGWPAMQGPIVGLVISVASTMVLARLLLDRGELHARHGRVMIGITLVEDLAVIVLTVVLPLLGTLEPARLLTVVTAVGLGIAALIPVAWLSSKLVPAVMLRVARTRSDELFLLVALAIGLGTAAFAQTVGLSLAVGAFLAGLVVSESDYAHETLARMLPVRDAFVAVFFVTIGALIDPSSVAGNLPLLGVIIALVVVGKLVVWTLVVRLFAYPLPVALRVAVGLTQIGEFSFILVQVARDAGHVGDDVYHATLAASLLTILLNATLVRLTATWLDAARLGGTVEPEAAPEPGRPGHVVICGFGRVGSGLGEALATFGIPYTAIERNPDVVRALRARGVRCVFGNAAQPSILQAAGVPHAALVIVALPEIDAARLAVRAVRALNPSVHVIARAHRAAEADDLRAVGANDIVQPELEAAATVIDNALRVMRLDEDAADAYLRRFRAAMHGADDRRFARRGLPQVHDLVLPPGGIADQSLREARIRERFGVTVVAIDRADGETVVNPPPETILRAGDRLRVFGLPAQIEAFATQAAKEN